MLTLLSPAKVNLFLRVLRRRFDGYHELASLFQTINLCDTLTFALADRDSFSCSDLSVPADPSNLIWKAVNLFRDKTRLQFNLRVNLLKRIPMEAGLGGGSSNAATTLWALNGLTGSRIDDSELAAWAGELGSDVAFFFSHGTAYCTGRGERVLSLDSLPSVELSIYRPAYGLSTPKVYGQLNASMLPQRDPLRVLEGFQRGSPLYFNDLETAAFQLAPHLAGFKNQIEGYGFETVMMSGSGSAFLAIGAPLKDADSTPPDVFRCQACYLNRLPGSWYEAPN